MRAALAVVLFLSTSGVRAVEPTAPGYREVERVVAVVNDDVVLLSEVEEQLVPLLGTLPPSLKDQERQKRVAEMRKDILEGLIADRLLQQQVEELQVDVTSDEIDRAIQEVKNQNRLDDEGLKQALAQQGMTMNSYRETMRKQMLKAKIINLKVRSKLSLTDKDIESAVARRARLQKEEFKVHARHALFAVPEGAPAEQEAQQKARAEELLKRAKAGEDFPTLVRTLSDPATASNGGDLGFFKRGDIMPAFEQAAFSTPPGEVTGPVRTPLGWHVIQVVERKSLETRSKDQIRDDLREQLINEELERAFKRYISELRKDAHVEVRL
ncbi:MAG: peptidylprolyl isomerase [Myxococcota bacterium]